MTERNVPVAMIRHGLEGIPCHDVPPGYALRWYRPGDERHWAAIHRTADLYNKVTVAVHHRCFEGDVARLRRRQCFLFETEGQTAVGTATAWYDPRYHGQSFGRIHWVAVTPEYQGRGLARTLLSAACLRLRALGHRRAYLLTSTVRVPAIHLYLRFGFLPDIRNGEEAMIWRALREETSGATRKLLEAEGVLP